MTSFLKGLVGYGNDFLLTWRAWFMSCPRRSTMKMSQKFIKYSKAKSVSTYWFIQVSGFIHLSTNTSFPWLNSLPAKSCYGGEKKSDSYFQVGTYRVAGTINKSVFLFYIRRNPLWPLHWIHNKSALTEQIDDGQYGQRDWCSLWAMPPPPVGQPSLAP